MSYSHQKTQSPLSNESLWAFKKTVEILNFVHVQYLIYRQEKELFFINRRRFLFRPFNFAALLDLEFLPGLVFPLERPRGALPRLRARPRNRVEIMVGEIVRVVMIRVVAVVHGIAVPVVRPVKAPGFSGLFLLQGLSDGLEKGYFGQHARDALNRGLLIVPPVPVVDLDLGSAGLERSVRVVVGKGAVIVEMGRLKVGKAPVALNRTSEAGTRGR